MRISNIKLKNVITYKEYKDMFKTKNIFAKVYLLLWYLVHIQFRTFKVTF